VKEPDFLLIKLINNLTLILSKKFGTKAEKLLRTHFFMLYQQQHSVKMCRNKVLGAKAVA
jgi:hypothetical protein